MRIRKRRLGFAGAWLIWLLAFSQCLSASEQGIESLRQTGKAFAAVARSASPSVVFIQIEGRAPAAAIGGPLPFGDGWPFNDDFFRRFFGEDFPAPPGRAPAPRQPRGRQVIGQGSGFVFDAKHGLLKDKTYILTNNHVVDKAEKIRVRLEDGREFDAKVTGRDPQSDIAVIEIDASGLPALRLGDSSKLEVGEWVVAMGNPFGLSHTLTVGVVSAKGRTSLGINDYEDFIQTDAAINPGNSGGPLLNLDGEVVGINTAIFTRSGGYMGVGFAIPSNLAREIARQLIDKGEVTRGYLGIVIQQLTADLAESFGLEPGQGVLVSQVTDDSPAAKAGIRQGDIVVAYQGRPVTDVGDFRNRVSLTPPGSRATLTVLRDGKRRTLTAVIGKLDENAVAAAAPAHSEEELGLTVQTLTSELARQFDVEADSGVVVTAVEPGSIAALAGIRPGTVILEVNREPVKTAADFKRAVAAAAGERRLLLLVRQDGMQRYLVLSW
ncbi:MAG: DegQ family serine endoprotease [Gammaproteobacteria bacterium]|nr:MAG: DegQ family serine endoprotease [Gammaproteobacteria bacterium]